MSEGVLLDTCAIIWLAQGATMHKASLEAIARARRKADGVHVSPISAWEIGLLVSRGRLTITTAMEAWWQRFVAQKGVRECPLDAATLIASSHLPGKSPADPADRIIVATARAQDLMLVTRDAVLLAYGRSGHARVLQC